MIDMMLVIGVKTKDRHLSESFPELLKRLRQAKGISQRQLHKLSGVHYSVIAAIEARYHGVSSKVAKKLAVGLGVEDQNQFILSAISTTKRQKVMSFAEPYSAEVLNFLALRLYCLGIEPAEIVAFEFRDQEGNKTSLDHCLDPMGLAKASYNNSCPGRKAHHGPLLSMDLRDGRKVLIDVELKIAPE